MNKLFKSAVVFFMSIIAISMSAQDYPTSLKYIDGDGAVKVKKTNWRIFAGPELSFLLGGDNSVMKGGKLGAYMGLELNQRISKKMYGVFGANLASGGFERWINNDPTVKSKTSYDQLTTIEVPLGLGINFGKEAPKGMFAQLTAINSITLTSLSNYTIVPLTSFEAQSNVQNNTFDMYNLGAKAEIGIKTNIEANSYSSFSLSAKTMFLNRFSTNTNQYTTLNIAALLGFYF
jgi:hypothetical protein